MALNIPISQWITDAKIWQAVEAEAIAKRRIFNGSSLAQNYYYILRFIRKSVEWAYGQNPNDPSLYKTANYMVSLVNVSAAEAIANSGTCTPPLISVNPISQSVSPASNVTFVVNATGTPILFYQWRKDGINIIGANSSSYTITGVVSANAGNYDCIVSNACGSSTSTQATLTVNAMTLNFTIGWSATDPYVNNLTPLTITNSQTVPFASGANLLFTGDLTNFANKYVMWSWPSTEPTPTGYFNTVLNSGSIPDIVIRDVYIVSGIKYACCRNPMVLDITQTLSLTH